MIYTILPTPEELGEASELAVLVTLTVNLHMANFALLASYPDLDPSGDSRPAHDPQEAYVYALLSQIRALESIVEAYLESARQLHSRGSSNSLKDVF